MIHETGFDDTFYYFGNERQMCARCADVGDLEVQVLSFGFGNCVLKAERLSGL